VVPLDLPARQALLELDPVPAKLRRLVDLLQKELAVRELGRKIASDTEERLTKKQRDFYLREQLRSIQRELGEEDEAASDVSALRRRVEEAALPEEARREAERELARLAGISPASPEHGMIHTLEHLSFAAAGLLYWWHLLSPIRSRLRLGGLGPVLYMASTKILVGFLGILLAFSPEVLYSFYEVGPNSTRWGLSALDDQRVAGLIMALEQSIVMGIALAYLFVRMLVESEEEDQRAERYGAA